MRRFAFAALALASCVSFRTDRLDEGPDFELSADEMEVEYSTEEPLHGDVSFTSNERVSIESANVWLAKHVFKAPRRVFWDLPHGDQLVANGIVRTFRGSKLLGNGLVGVADGQLVGIAIAGDLTYTGAIAAHEFGHLAGCKHYDKADIGLMSPVNLIGAPTWTYQDSVVCGVSGSRKDM